MNVADAIYDVNTDLSEGCSIINPFDPTHHRTLKGDLEYEDLLVPIFRNGSRVYELPSIHEIRKKTIDELAQFFCWDETFSSTPISTQLEWSSLSTI
jgi:nicotinate phosphoribosyltransferase